MRPYLCRILRLFSRTLQRRNGSNPRSKARRPAIRSMRSMTPWSSQPHSKSGSGKNSTCGEASAALNGRLLLVKARGLAFETHDRNPTTAITHRAGFIEHRSELFNRQHDLTRELLTGPALRTFDPHAYLCHRSP